MIFIIKTSTGHSQPSKLGDSTFNMAMYYSLLYMYWKELLMLSRQRELVRTYFCARIILMPSNWIFSLAPHLRIKPPILPTHLMVKCVWSTLKSVQDNVVGKWGAECFSMTAGRHMIEWEDTYLSVGDRSVLIALYYHSLDLYYFDPWVKVRSYIQNLFMHLDTINTSSHWHQSHELRIIAMLYVLL